MSESKAEYYAKHLERQAPGGNVILGPNETMETVQPTGLPTLLAKMVNEFRGALSKADGSDNEILVFDFNKSLLACAQPLLAEYLTAITTPPQFVVKQRQEGEASLPMMVRALEAAERAVAEDNARAIAEANAKVAEMQRESARIRSGKL